MEIHLADPRFDSWETVETYEDVGTARAFAAQLNEWGIDVALTADHERERHGKGDIFLCVPADQLIEASELIEFPDASDSE